MTRAEADGYPYHQETSAVLRSTPPELFQYADDPLRLATHMDESSWMLFGGRFTTDVDADGGRTVGSHIRMHGRVLGLELALDESVTERNPPRRKTWETIGEPRLLVIGRYRMGFDIVPAATGSTFRVFIDYALPASVPGRWFGRVFAPCYARWCTRRMLDDVVRNFVLPRVGA